MYEGGGRGRGGYSNNCKYRLPELIKNMVAEQSYTELVMHKMVKVYQLHYTRQANSPIIPTNRFLNTNDPTHTHSSM